MDTDQIERAVEQRRVWLQGQLDAAAPRFGVELVGEAVNTFDMRSAGAEARDGDQDVWLRVVVEDPDYQPACRWDGNVEANSICGVAKPEVLRWADWHHTDSYLAGRRLRGEVMTLAPGSTIAPGGVLFDDPHLPQSWWTDLSTALDALAAHPPNMENELGAVRYTINGVRQHFGVTLTEHTFVGLHWATAHADLHWGNLRGPQLCVLDWESWRPAPAGYDAATLYCNSLLHPPTARRVRARQIWPPTVARSRSSSRSAATSGASARAATSTRPRSTFAPKERTSCPASTTDHPRTGWEVPYGRAVRAVSEGACCDTGSCPSGGVGVIHARA